MEAYRLYYTVKYRVGGYKLPYMVCHVLLEGQGWSPDHPDQLPLSLILVYDIEETTSSLCQVAECLKNLQIYYQNRQENSLEMSLKMIFL